MPLTGSSGTSHCLWHKNKCQSSGSEQHEVLCSSRRFLNEALGWLMQREINSTSRNWRGQKIFWFYKAPLFQQLLFSSLQKSTRSVNDGTGKRWSWCALLAAAQDRVLREGNDGQGTKVTSCCLGEKGQKIIHAFRHQSRAEGFFSKCVTAERDGLSPEQGTPPDCLINFPLVLSINSLCYLFQKLENFFSYMWTSLYPH